MAKNHGARQQKRIAKHKAKRAAKRTFLSRALSQDPTVRLRGAAKWRVVHSLEADELFDTGIGHMAIAREDGAGKLVFAVFLVDTYCMGVKNAFWRTGTREEFQEMMEQMETKRAMSPIAPERLVKIIEGAVDYAHALGISPHPDYGHASMLLAGIDSSTCTDPISFGRDGKPFYIQGPFDSPTVAEAIVQRVRAAAGHFLVGGPIAGEGAIDEIEDEYEELDSLGAATSPAGTRSSACHRWTGGAGTGRILCIYQPQERLVRLRMTAGQEQGTRHRIARALGREAARHALLIELHPTAGSDEAMAAVESGGVDAAFVQGGLDMAFHPTLRQVAVLHVEPLHLLVRTRSSPR